RVLASCSQFQPSKSSLLSSSSLSSPLRLPRQLLFTLAPIFRPLLFSSCFPLASAVTLSCFRVLPRELILMPDMRDALGVLLAGGQGERLWPLTRDRAKPAVPFGALYRIIDVTLSNCINSSLHRVFVLTQYKALSLNRHIRAGWSPLMGLGEFIEVLPPQMRVS